MTALFWPLFAWSAWPQAATVEAGTTDEDAALDSVRLVGMGLTSHCGGGNERIGHSSGFRSLFRLGPSKPL